jgi:metal-sulfur cluster biosynthetic enzyme
MDEKMEQLRNQTIIDALMNCTDPEIGLSIVDIGLIYNIKIDPNNNIDLTMTMTSPMCPVTSVILADAQLRVQAVPGAGNVNIDLVWDPMWNPEMMSDEVKMQL